MKNLFHPAAKARIKQGEQYYASVGANIEFTCDSIGLGTNQATKQHQLQYQQMVSTQGQETYWYFNGNLLNYQAPQSTSVGVGVGAGAGAGANGSGSSNGNKFMMTQTNSMLIPRNFSIERDNSYPLATSSSRFKLSNVQLSDSGNYTCKPTSAEPATIRLNVKSLYHSRSRKLPKNYAFLS